MVAAGGIPPKTLGGAQNLAIASVQVMGRYFPARIQAKAIPAAPRFAAPLRTPGAVISMK
jgi:hypothetical protein